MSHLSNAPLRITIKQVNFTGTLFRELEIIAVFADT